MKTKILIGLASIALIVVAIVVIVKQPEPQPVENKEAVETMQKIKQKRLENSKRLAELKAQRGGLPIDHALKAAKNDEQRAYIEKTMGDQRQTPEQSLAEIRKRLEEVRDQMDQTKDEKKLAELKKQEEMLLTLEKSFM